MTIKITNLPRLSGGLLPELWHSPEQRQYGHCFGKIRYETKLITIEKVFSIGETFVGVAAAVAPLIAGFIADSFGVISVLYLAVFIVLVATVPGYLFQLRMKESLVAQYFPFLSVYKSWFQKKSCKRSR